MFGPFSPCLGTVNDVGVLFLLDTVIKATPPLNTFPPGRDPRRFVRP